MAINPIISVQRPSQIRPFLFPAAGDLISEDSINSPALAMLERSGAISLLGSTEGAAQAGRTVMSRPACAAPHREPSHSK